MVRWLSVVVMNVNPIAFQDGHRMIGPENTINDVLRVTSERIRDSGDSNSVGQGQLVERARSRWSAEKVALIKDLTDMHVAAVLGKDRRSFRPKIEDKLKWWKEMEQMLAADAKTQSADNADIDAQITGINNELRNTGNSFAGRDVAGYRVLINAQRTLYALWTTHVNALEEAHREDLREAVGILHGLLNGLRATRKYHTDSIGVAEADFATLRKSIAEGPLEIQGLSASCAKLKQTLINDVYTPLRSELLKGGVDPNFAAIPISAASATSDPFSVRECLAIEEVLLDLPNVYSHGASAQNQALVDAKAHIAELRQQWRALSREETHVLADPNRRPSDTAAAIRVLHSQTVSVKDEINKAESRVRALISTKAQPEKETTPAERDVLLKRTRELLEACRTVRRTVQSAKTFGATFQRIAEAQHTKNLELFQDTAKDECRTVEADAHHRITAHAKRAAVAFKEANNVLSEADVVDEARASQRIEARASSEMALHGRIERAVQLRRAMTKANARLVETNAHIRIARRVIALCTNMLKEL